MFNYNLQCELTDPLQGRSHSVRSAGVHKVLDRMDATTAMLCFHPLSANLSTRGAQGPASEG